MSRDVVGHSLADARAVSDLFERVSPSVIWQKLWVRDTEVANPISKTLSGLGVARLLCSQRIVPTILLCNSVEHGASPVLLHELQKALFDQVVVNWHDAGLLDRYLRRILVVGAHAVLKLARQKPEKYPWLTQLLARKPFKIVAVALANKMARIAWALLVKGGPYRARALVAAA